MLGLGKKDKGAKPTAQEASADGSDDTQRLRQGLGRTRGRIGDGIGGVLAGLASGFSAALAKDDSGLFADVEAQLLSADVGPAATEQIIGGLKARLGRRKSADSATFMAELRQELSTILAPCSLPLEVLPAVADAAEGKADRDADSAQLPFVILMVGVNGVGKTTTIGKLAARFKQQGLSVMLAAGDTFRAAAAEQLQAWGQRNQVPVVAQKPGADSAAVIYDACNAARAAATDVLIADTAGRLHTKDNLMAQLEKILRVLRRLDPRLPNEVLLVLDATTGQNAISQTESFHKSLPVSGLVLSKLDGTAKGGVVFALAKQFGIPIRFIGVGEGAADLRPFNAEEFVAALF